VLQELAGETGASGWAIASMLFFLGVWLVMAVRVWRARPETMSERARMPLDDGEAAAGAVPRD
jgi:hypothetical protein